MILLICSPGRERITHLIHYLPQHFASALLRINTDPLARAYARARTLSGGQRLLGSHEGRIAVRSFAIATIGVLVCLSCAIADLSDIRGREAAPPSPLVTVRVDDSTIALSTSTATVGELLELLEIALSDLDRTDPSPDTPIVDGLEVSVTRVTRCEQVEEDTIPSEMVVLADPDRPAGFTKILRHGQEGRVKKVWRIWEKDGVETSRGILSEEILQESSDTVVLRGTHGSPNRGGDWRRPVVMEATAYDPGPRSCGKWASGYTATGAKAERGIVAVDDRVIPMGTRMYIPDYGFALAADRGGAIKGMRIDLCYSTYAEAIQFGRRKVKVYLLD